VNDPDGLIGFQPADGESRIVARDAIAQTANRFAPRSKLATVAEAGEADLFSVLPTYGWASGGADYACIASSTKREIAATVPLRVELENAP
jgi:hypothetical protein